MAQNPYAYGSVGGSGLTQNDRQQYGFIRNEVSDDASLLRNNTLYDYSNPQYAFRNALSEHGVNPYAANPFLKTLNDRIAPGLGNTFETYMSGTGARPGDTPQTGTYFKNFVGDLLSQGGLATAPQRAGSEIENAVRQSRTLRAHQGAGTPANTLNPFTMSLSDRLASNSGRGTVDALMQAYSPYMNPRMANAYQTSLNANLESSLRQMSANPLDTTRDIWSYLLGV